MKYDVYRHKNATDEQFLAMDKFFKQVEEEDKDLCVGAQINLNLGTYGAGKLQPCAELGVLHFQDFVRKAVVEHHQKEKEAGKELCPASFSAAENDDMKLCNELETCWSAKGAQW